MIYLDNAATTPLLESVVEAMSQTLKEVYGNASSVNHLGRLAKQKIEWARQIIAQSIHAKPSEIIFTSGASESNNAAIQALVKHSDKKHIITSNVEHPSVYEVMQTLEKQGYQVTYLPVNQDGIVSIEDFKKAINEDTGIISIMSVNNENGAIQPIEEIAKLAKEHHIYFHTDAVQAYGFLPIDVTKTSVDMLSVSAHKIHGPKGIGFLYVKEGIPFTPFIQGGSQENTRRAGTESVHNIVGFGVAVESMQLNESKRHAQDMQQFCLEQLKQHNVSFVVNGALDDTKKVAKILNIWLPNVSSSKLLMQLDLSGIVVSAGSACSAGSLQPSRIIQAQFPQEINRASESIRLSFSKLTTKEDILALVEKLSKFSV